MSKVAENKATRLLGLEKAWVDAKQREEEAKAERYALEQEIEAMHGGFTLGTTRLSLVQITQGTDRKPDQLAIDEIVERRPMLEGNAFKSEWKLDNRFINSRLKTGGELADELRKCYTEKTKKPSFSLL